MKIAELRLGFGFVPRSRMDSEDLDYSARIKWFHFVIMLHIFIVLLSVTACRRKRFLWPMANKVNIT